MSSELEKDLEEVSVVAIRYFDSASELATEADGNTYGDRFSPSNHFWDQLNGELQSAARELISKILPICAAAGEAAKVSVLTGSEDTQDIKFATKRIRAALALRRFTFSNIEVIHDEGTVLGINPSRQDEDYGLPPSEAKSEFNEALRMIYNVLHLINATSASNSEYDILEPEASKYRSGTAFIMMWMDPRSPDLTDVMDAVKDVFRKFSIRALRADEIEHEGKITDRILNEIKTSEFLFADLTGMRPNVYYETGYAHALGKRVILFRKSGTSLHFDLAGYNCPEYENLRDLKEKLTKRLVSITNKQPNENDEI